MIIITGASRGIGKYLFDRFTGEGLQVIGTYNNTKINDDNMVSLDVTNYLEVESVINELDLTNVTLINCAGINYNAFAHKSDPEKWKNVFEVNLFGTYNMIRSLLPFMRENKYGRIINFSSVVAEKATPGVSAYAASKSALIGLSKSIAVENAEKNITVNNINMGYSEFGMINDVPEKFLEVIKNQIPNKRLCSGDNIYDVVKLFINNDYLNGTSINLNGGLI